MIGHRWVEVRSSLGNVYRFQVPRLPAIHRQLLGSVVFLYRSEDEAREGSPDGGTGFLTSTPTDEVWEPIQHQVSPQGFEESVERHVYVVTAKHVINQGATVMRMNVPGGGVEVFPVPRDAWKPHPDGTELVVARLGMATEEWRERVVPSQMFVTRWEVYETGFLNPQGSIGAGDECFFIGRFSTHEGREANRPSVRFGALAMTHGETIRDSNGIEQESVLVEARSLSGYSGSPVFVYQSALMDDNGEVRPLVSSRVRFLGVDWCHLSKFEPVLGEDKKHPVVPKQWVRRNTGMAGVIPAWKLAELLNDPEVVEMRRDAAKEHEDRERAERERRGGEATFDIAQAGESEFDRFEALTERLVRVSKRELDEKRGEDG